MLRWINRIIQELSGSTFKLILSMGGFLLLWGIFAPVGTIVWWLNQNAETLGLTKDDSPKTIFASSQTASKIDCYIVFLPGIGNFSPDELALGEKHFIDRLAAEHPNCVAVRDVFPYSVTNKDLGSERLLQPLWKAAKENDQLLGSVLIPLRNLWRFAISSDYRYSSVYSMGIADTIVNRMNAAHPIPRSPKPINLILISTSGGTQVALASSTYLKKWLKPRLTVISIGGAFDGRVGFDSVDHVYHLQGEQDLVPTLTYAVFPSRWNWTVGSPINQAQQQGRFTVCSTGAHEHSGDKGYFGTAIAANHQPYVEQTIQQVKQLPIWSIDQPLTSECPQR